MDDPKKVNWTRRLFVKEALLGWSGVVLGPSAYAASVRWLTSSKLRNEAFKDIGSIEEFGIGASKEVPFAGTKVIVVRSGADTWIGLSAICTHLGCSIRLVQSGTAVRFACNCHSSTFDQDGMNLGGPAPAPLKKFAVRAVGGRVLLEAIEPAISG
jgi:cytochrome b6-f complex iron-sulfur subunit